MRETTAKALLWNACGDLAPRDARNQRRFLSWCLAWAAALVAVTFALKHGTLPAGPLAGSLAVVPSLVGVGAVGSYVAFLRDADELVRRIHLEALAWGFGSGVLLMVGYPVAELAGAPQLGMLAPLQVSLWMWAGATVVVARRYR